jgi:endothelin-converting enzyme-like 1
MDLNALNASCNNFASFSCGKFQNGLIHERYGDMTKEGLELDFATYKLMQFFETFQSESKIYKEAKKFFDSCMDEKQLVKLGNKPVLDIINELGGWINSPNSNSPSNWENLHNSIFKMGITNNFLIKTWLDNNPKNMSEYAIFIKAEDSHILDGGILDILENDEKQPEHIESYYNYMFDTYKAFYGDESVDKKVESSLNKIFKFEKLYTRVLFGRQFDERYEGKEEKRISYTIEKLQLHYPFMNWAKFFKVRLGMFESEDLDKNTTIIVDHPGFIANLNFFLKRQSDSSIQNFLMWKVVDHITTLLPRKLKPFRATLFRDAFGIQRFPEQWDTCFKLTSRLFPLVIANINVYNFKTNVQNSENLYEKLEDLVEMVKGELKNVLKEEEYLDLTAENIEDFSDYVETIEILDPVRNEVFTDERIESYYESIDFTLDDDYYSTVLKMRKFAARKRGILRYYRHVKDTIWEAHADIIDSEDGSFITTHFDPDKNYIYLGTKDLTSPNFDVTYPNFITYSGIGYEVAVAFYNLISYRVSTLTTSKLKLIFKSISFLNLGKTQL